MSIIKKGSKIPYPARTIEPCPICNGTGLEIEEARLIWKRKLGITHNELIWLITKKLNSNLFITDSKSYVSFKISQMDLLQIIKQRGIWVPCSHCMGKGFLHNINEGVELIENTNSNL